MPDLREDGRMHRFPLYVLLINEAYSISVVY